jgi:hypothetical protein
MPIEDGNNELGSAVTVEAIGWHNGVRHILTYLAVLLGPDRMLIPVGG